MQEGNNRIEIRRWVDTQVDRVMNRGRGVAETEVKSGSYGRAQHFESDILCNNMDRNIKEKIDNIISLLILTA